jgi:hypothetical protein
MKAIKSLPQNIHETGAQFRFHQLLAATSPRLDFSAMRRRFSYLWRDPMAEDVGANCEPYRVLMPVLTISHKNCITAGYVPKHH